MNGRTIFAAECGFEIAQMALLFHQLPMTLPLVGREVELGGDIDGEQFIPAAVPQHPYHRVIHFDEAASRCAEEQAFLNVVEELAIAPLGLAAVRDILQNVDGLEAIATCPVHTGRRYQIGAIQNGMSKLGGILAPQVAEWAGVRSRVAGQRHQGADIESNQLRGRHTDHLRQRPIHP